MGVGKGEKGFAGKFAMKKKFWSVGDGIKCTAYRALHIAWPLFAKNRERGDALQDYWVLRGRRGQKLFESFVVNLT